MLLLLRRLSQEILKGRLETGVGNAVSQEGSKQNGNYYAYNHVFVQTLAPRQTGQTANIRLSSFDLAS